MIIALFDGNAGASGTYAAILVARSAARAGDPTTLSRVVVGRESGLGRVATVPDVPSVVERLLAGPSPSGAPHGYPGAGPDRPSDARRPARATLPAAKPGTPGLRSVPASPFRQPDRGAPPAEEGKRRDPGSLSSRGQGASPPVTTSVRRE